MARDVREAVAAATATVQQVWPPDEVQLESALSVLLVAEGYTAADEPAFAALCRQLVDALLDTPPFGLLRFHQGRLGVWRLFRASNQAGPAWGTVPGDTLLRSAYDHDSGTLELDETLLENLLEGTAIPGLDGTSRAAIGLCYPRWPPPRPGVVVVLVPQTAAGHPVTAELDAGPDGAAVGPSYVATTVDAGWERVVVRALARAYGLADEFSLADPAHAAPEPWAVIAASVAPNLVAIPASPPTGRPSADLKWYTELSPLARLQPVVVVGYGQPEPAPAEQLQLFEGGGGYRSQIYRSAPDCMMRRMIGGGAISPRYDFIDFCTVCKRFLMRSIAGSTGTVEQVRLSRQQLEFDRVATADWEHDETVTSFPMPPRTETATTKSTGSWWGYTVKVGPAIEPGDSPSGPPYGGMLIQDLQLLGQEPDSLAIPTVARRIEFRDVVAVLDDGDVRPFDFAAAFANTAAPPLFRYTSNGHVGADRNYLRGMKLTLHDDLGGRCRVTLELALVLKGEATDIDPGGVVYAVKLYPQMALSWSRGSGQHPPRVVRFRGCVRIVMSNRGKVDAAPPESIASFFVDTNLAAPTSRRLETVEGGTVLEGTAFPTPSSWGAIFDYYKPHLQYDTEIYAVYGPLAGLVSATAGKRRTRQGRCAWPPGSSNDFVVQKVRDQGAYDNIHLNWSMGPDPADPAGGPMIHAPGCAEACIHLHWRWGVLAGIPIVPNPYKVFHGWTRGPSDGEPVAHDSPYHQDLLNGSPLIPPNQDLHVAVTNPATRRSGLVPALSPVVPPVDPARAVATSSTPLDPAMKAIWYTVDVTDPREGQRQVLLEEGVSFAFRYNWDCFLFEVLLWMVRRAEGWRLDGASKEHVAHEAYSYIRWYRDSTWNATSVQVPTGDVLVSPGSIALEEL